jgi:Zn-dependent protease with chaperone function
MFALRGLAVCLSFFAVVYAVTSALVSRTWRYCKRSKAAARPEVVSRLLLNLRMLPLLAAVVITVGIVLPSFLMLEPPTAAEAIGEAPAILALGCVVLFAGGLLNAFLAWRRTAKTVHNWLKGANSESRPEGVTLFRIRPPAPPLAVAGICRPRVLLSDAAVDALTQAELKTALKHEMAHVRRRDNLKKLFFRFTAFPGMTALETEWSEAAEMAADDAAVSNCGEALDLAGALIKISRLGIPATSPVLTTALVSATNSALNARIERLVMWEQRSEQLPQASHRWYLAPALFVSILCVLASYSALLSRMHQMTEWLVR